jgi:putative SOS response-associated peptidase YedK
LASTSTPECTAFGGDEDRHLCNLYSLTKGQQAIRELAGRHERSNGQLAAAGRHISRLPSAHCPQSTARPRTYDGALGHALACLRAEGRNSVTGVANIRNVKSLHWRRWLGIGHRCVVPFTSFRENETVADGSKPPVWFALDETRPLACFAGIWTHWTSVRKVKEGETTNDLFVFLTTEPNREVGAIHPQAMPVILTSRKQIDLWMTAPAEDALKLQRPLADGALMIVARGEKTDEGGLAA